MCAVPISAGGKCCQWVCTTGLALTNQQLQLSYYDHYLGGPPLANNGCSLVSRVVVGCAPSHVDLMCGSWPCMIEALHSSNTIQCWNDYLQGNECDSTIDSQCDANSLEGDLH